MDLLSLERDFDKALRVLSLKNPNKTIDWAEIQ